MTDKCLVMIAVFEAGNGSTLDFDELKAAVQYSGAFFSPEPKVIVYKTRTVAEVEAWVEQQLEGCKDE
ncbi:MAG: hypothetical protein GWO10_16340 [candidate division Zixibacteria bacterium]|nr:hypothetical protein [Gammaproteobacteria bacterium]NIR25702.1 hypothetical protein [Gammaproteobacteria bacterium]NIR65295.1 hypothetical protein [candidate division Zixibacteria bacterium]NIS52339.1 hypothetical protein [Phycisphaerae bacterium]NIX02138.1 hypothetical protein [Phycisphaerae bacterium]